jgi:hypothetical protein
MQQIYFRAIFSHGQMQRWLAKQYNSYYHEVPPMWSGTWREKHSLNPADYDLSYRIDDIVRAVYTKKALDAFLRLAPTHSDTDLWPFDQLREVSELDGLCAFDNPHDAFKHGNGSFTGKYGYDRYVEFMGEYVCPAPEGNGVVARVVEATMDPVDAVTFCRRHDL